MICNNKRARHEYFIEENFEAGMVLEGWEVKAVRAKKVSIEEAYVRVINGQIKLIGCHMTPPDSTISGFAHHDPTRTRDLLLNRREIDKLIGKVEIAGFTLVPLDLHFKKGRIKMQIGLAKGKKLHDKRQAAKERDMDRDARRGE
jgi:SsrA-binding protein